MAEFSVREQWEIDQANHCGRTPILFVHGLWLLSDSWGRWRQHFEAAGFCTLTPNWPHAARGAASKERPEVQIRQAVSQVSDHFDDVVRKLDHKPVIIGHSFGGLLAQILASRELSRATVVIDPAPYRSLLPLPLTSLRPTSPVLAAPTHRSRTIALSLEQFREGFTTQVGEEEVSELYEACAVSVADGNAYQPASNNPTAWSGVEVDAKAQERGPMLVISGRRRHTLAWAIADAAYREQSKNSGVTEIVELQDRGHALTIDHRWREVADIAKNFIERFVTP